MDECLRPSPLFKGQLSDLFYCWIRKKTKDGEEFLPAEPADFWKYDFSEHEYTDFVNSNYVKPKGVLTTSLRSKRAFDYGTFELRARLPEAERGPVLWFGFELDDLFAGGLSHFGYWTHNGSLRGFCGAASLKATIDLTRFLPSDHQQVKHWYKITRGREFTLWFIDGKIRGMCVSAAGAPTGTVYDGIEYSLALNGDMPSRRLPVLLDIDGADQADYAWEGLNPWDLRVSDGISGAPLHLKLEDEGGVLANRPLKKETKIISGPFPAIGNVRVRVASNAQLKITLEASDDGELWFPVAYAEGSIPSVEARSPGLIGRVIIESPEGGVLTGASATVFPS
ncbi:MAG: hypothetical protein RAK25_05395 [TACK group archaeon]|nr:hypothetical protein [TACK group archaeon]